ncbi:MAG: peptidylprolyl isomerase [Chthoniobacteraceae bacterium]
MNIRPALVSALSAVFTLGALAADKDAKPAPAKPAPAAAAPAAPAAPAFELKDPLATVDGAPVTIADVEKVLTTILAQQGATIAQVPAEMKPQLYRQVLDGVIVERLVTREAAKLEVTDAEMEAEFTKFKGQFPTEDEMKAQLAKGGQTPESIRVEIRRFLQQNRWLEAQVKDKSAVTDADAEAFYKGNPEQFKTPEQVRASHILIKCEKEAAEAEVKAKTEAAVKVLARVKKGEDFATLAGELSEDPSAKENKGDLNFFGREQMVPEFSEAAFAMKKGDVSAAPVRSQFGFHVIKVTDRKEAGTMPFDEAKPKLIGFLGEQKRKTETGKVLTALREKATVKVNLPDAPAAPAEAK